MLNAKPPSPLSYSRHLPPRDGRTAGEFDAFCAARNPKRLTASTICSTVTRAGSKTTSACFARRLTSARLTPFSPSRAFLTATGHVPHVIPSTKSVTVDAA